MNDVDDKNAYNKILENQDVWFSNYYKDYHYLHDYDIFRGLDEYKALIKTTEDAIKNHALPLDLIQPYLEGSSAWEILSENQKNEILDRFRNNTYFSIESLLHPERWWIIGTRGKPEFYFDECGNDISSVFHDSIITEYGSGIIHIFNRDRYLQDAEPFIQSLIQHSVPITFIQINRAVQYIKNKTRIVDPDLLDKTMEEIRPLPGNLIPLQQGLLNLETREILPHSPAYYYISIFSRTYIPGGKSTKFHDFLEIIFKDDLEKETKITQIFEIIAWSISPDYVPHGAAFLIGSGGEGKSIIISIIEALLGPGNTSSISIQELESDKFKRAELYGKHANIVNEAGGIIRSEWFKKTSDQSTITADRKNGGNFKFKNHAKWIMATNKLPEVDNELRAFYRRVAVMINFDNYLEDNLSPEEISEYVNSLLLPKELDLIFSETLDKYYNDFSKRKKFTAQPSIEDAEAEYNRRSNPNLAYLQELSDKGLIFTDPEELSTFITENSIDQELVYKEDKKTGTRHFVSIKKYIEKDAKQWARERKLQPDLIDTLKLGKALAKLDYPDITTEKRIESTKLKAWLDVFIVPYNLIVFRSPKTNDGQNTLDNNVKAQEENKTINPSNSDINSLPDGQVKEPVIEEQEYSNMETEPLYYRLNKDFNKFDGAFFYSGHIIVDSVRKIMVHGTSNVAYALYKLRIPKHATDSDYPKGWLSFTTSAEPLDEKAYNALSKGGSS